MAVLQHGDLTIASGIHVPYAFIYTNASARNSATGLTSISIGKFALQNDDKTIWMLTSITPVTWKQISVANLSAAGIALLDDADVAAQRTTLELGDSATKNVGTDSNSVAVGDHVHSAADNHIASTANPHEVTAAQVGADPAGTAAAAISAHTSALEPHSMYVTADDLAANAPVLSVAGKTGPVTLIASDVGADPTGTASTAVAAHVSNATPHAGKYPLLSGGKILAEHLPSSVLQFKGTYHAGTHTPALADGTGTAGDVYSVSVGGNPTFGTGNSPVLAAGDWVIYNGSIWEKSPQATSLVLSDVTPIVNGSGAAGSSDVAAREDHVHPTDTSRASASHTHTQATSHESPDTDTATSSLHHTIGTGATQAAAGNHTHTDVYEPAITTLGVAKGGTGTTVLTGFVYGNGTDAMTASTTVPGTSISGDIPGNAANVSGTVAVANGGTGATSLTGFVSGNGTDAMTASATIPGSAIAGDIAGTATNVTGTVAIANGGTGATTAALARNNLGLGNTTGPLPVANGGTGAATVVAARNALGLGQTSGPLPLANGGTGVTTAASARNVLGLGLTTGPVPVANGGTGAATAAAARNNLGLGNTAGALPVANGGTGATTALAARTAIGAAATSHTHIASEVGADTAAAAAVSTHVGESDPHAGKYPLLVGGKIATSFLPGAVMQYRGAYNATTNSPTIIDGTGTAGDIYNVSVGGTQNFGSGSISLSAGDWLIYNGTVWEKSSQASSVTLSDANPSMNGTAAAGVNAAASRGDHVHPTDTSRAAASHVHAQADSHGSADTDSATSSLHHTIGSSATQAAAGNHTHSAADAHIASTSNPHSVTAVQVGAMATSHAANIITGLGTSGAATTVARSDHAHSAADAHLASTSNPHSVTAVQVGAIATSHAANAITGFGTSGAATTVARSDHAHSAADAHLTSTSNPHSVTAVQVGAIATSHAANAITGFGVSGAATTVARSDHAHSAADAHLASTTNPHSTTAAQVGADPAGSASAVNSTLSSHTGNTSNPHSVTASQVGALPIGGGTLAGALSLHADPTSAMHAVTKQYADAVAAGFGPKNSCQAATTTSLVAVSYSNKVLTASSNGAISIDDISLTSTQRLLVKNGVNVNGAGVSNVYNGIYYVSQVGDGSNPWKLTRSADFDGTPEGEIVTGNYTFIEQGTANAKTGWAVLTTGTITIDNTALTFGQVSALTEISNLPTSQGGTGTTSYTQGDILYYDSGTALSKLAKNTSATRALLNSGTDNNPAWGQVPLGSGVTGTLPVGNGGTGATTLTGFVYGNGAGAMTASTSISGSAISGNISGNAANVTGIVDEANGGTGVNSTSTTAKYFFASPNGAAGAPSFRAIVASDIPTLNQNTTGSSASCTGNAASATYASAVTLTADNSTNATNYPLFVDAATGNESPRTDTGFTYNPSTGALTTTTFVGALTGNASGSSGSCTGNAASATYASNTTVTADATAATRYVTFVSATSGNIGQMVDAGLTYNPSTNVLTATVSGSSTSCTGNAASATYASAVTLTADNSTNATNYPLFVNAATGNLSPRTDTGLTYNPSTGRLTVAVMSIGTAAPATPANGDIWMV